MGLLTIGGAFLFFLLSLPAVAGPPGPTEPPRIDNAPWGRNLRVNDDVLTTTQGSPAVAADASGNAYALWTDFRNDPGGQCGVVTCNSDIYFSRLVGTDRWGHNLKVNDDVTTATQRSPAIAVDASGNAYAVWEDYRNDPDGVCDNTTCASNVYFSKLPAGSTTWSSNVRVNEIPISTTITTTVARNPAIAVDGAGNAYAVWEDYRNRPFNADIYFAKLPAGSSTWGTNRRVNDDYGGNALNPKIAVHSAGNAHAVWQDLRHGYYDIYSSKLAAGSGTWGPNRRVNDDRDDLRTIDQLYPGVAVDGAGNAYAVWEDYRNVHSDIYFSEMLSGTTTWSPNRKVNDDTGTAEQRYPSIAADRWGNAYAVWADKRLSSVKADIYFSKLAAGSTTWLRNLRVNDEHERSPQHQDHPVIAVDRGVNVYAAWEDYRRTGDGGDIGASKLLADAVPLELREVRASPRPFNPGTGTPVSYTLSRSATATLVVLDGELNPVRSLGPVARRAGAASFFWDGRNQAGQVVSPGLYIPVVVANAGAENTHAYALATADNGVAPAISNLAANPPRVTPPGGAAVSYRVSKGSVQALLVLNASGVEVRRIVAGYKKAGAVSISWDGKNNAGRYVPNGSYVLVPVAIDLMGRVGWGLAPVRVGGAAALSVEGARKLASAWIEGHRAELSTLAATTVKAKLSGLP